MRRFWILLGVIVMVLAVAAPAAADKPAKFEVPQFSVPGLDPCTGLDHEVTFDLTLYEHFHGDRYVMRVEKAGFTDSGYVMLGSNHHMQVNNNTTTMRYKDVWRNPLTGDMFHATEMMRFAGNSTPVVEGLTLRCITGPTLP